MKDILNGFANVGNLQDDLDVRELQNRNSNEVTMGTGVPRQSEGKIGDITVRQVQGDLIKVYIKTSFGGWYDVNTLSSQIILDWHNLAFKINATTHSSWSTNPSSGQPARYTKDANGFVHLTGFITSLKFSTHQPTPSAAWQASQSHTDISPSSYSTTLSDGLVCNISTDGSGDPTFTLVKMGDGHLVGGTATFTDPGNTSNTANITFAEYNSSGSISNQDIAILPAGYRPKATIYLAVAQNTTGDTHAIKIGSDGLIEPTGSGLNGGLVSLDGVSFFASQPLESIVQGGSKHGKGKTKINKGLSQF